MTEQQRRQQIIEARQREQRPVVSSITDSEAERMASAHQGITQEQMIAVAMLGKMVSNDIIGIKKNAIGDSLKVTDVDMSKVMPSSIMKAMGTPVPQFQSPQPSQLSPLRQQPTQQQLVSVAPVINTIPSPQLPFVDNLIPQPYIDPNQLELDLNKQTRYEDIINAIDKLQNSVNILTDKVNTLIDSSNKKKPKVTNGTQAG
jgi:hypothetical protein